MRAIVIRRHGGPEVLEPTDLPRPEPAAGEALVRVAAVSVNAFLDVSNRAGAVPFARYDFPHVLGSEHAGRVEAYGPATDGPVPVGTDVVVRNTVFRRSLPGARHHRRPPARRLRGVHDRPRREPACPARRLLTRRRHRHGRQRPPGLRPAPLGRARHHPHRARAGRRVVVGVDGRDRRRGAGQDRHRHGPRHRTRGTAGRAADVRRRSRLHRARCRRPDRRAQRRGSTS